MLRYFTFLALLVPMIMARPASAQDIDFADWDVFLDGVRTEALERGISQDLISEAFDGMEPLKRVIKSDRKQAEFKMTLDRYMVRRVSEARVNNGLRMMQENADLLREVSEKYDVQPRYIVAIWGMETNYGLYLPKEEAVRALATLAYDKRRGAFFRKELLSALEIVNAGHIELSSLKGSWAGAMGQSQFMPSSYLNYAVDHDGDGRIDIWNTKADIFASIANYLSKHGWKGDHSWGRRVSLPEGFDEKIAELSTNPPDGCRAMKAHTQQLSLNEWQELGVRRQNQQDLPKRDLPASMLQPDGEGGPTFLAYPNYKAILSYNCANLYALSVGHLAEKIK